MKKFVFILSGLLFFIMPLRADATVPENGKIVFEILRGGQSFGMHSLQFTELTDGKTQVDIDINMRFAIGPLTLFRYQHNNTEIWDDDRILSVSSTTNDDGDDYSLEAVWDENILRAATAEQTFEAPKNIYSTSYWNKIALNGTQLLNTQKGTIEDIKVTKAGQADLFFDWGTVRADIYDIDTVVPIRAYYDSITKEWVSLSFTARGSEVTYRRLTPISKTTLNHEH
jgi:hypothetical protein